MDATTPKYSMDRYFEIRNQVLPLLSKVGYNTDDIPSVPISSFDGDNLIERSTNFDWYKGPTLLEAIEKMKQPTKPSNLPLRLPIMDFYKIGGIGVVPVGRVETGSLCPGMSVTFAPTGLQTEVKSVEIYPRILATRLQAEANSSEMHRETLDVAYPGDIVGFNVDISATDLKQGYVASNTNEDPAKEATHFISHVIITNLPGQISEGYTPILHCHTSHIAVIFDELIYKVDNFSTKIIEKNPPFLKDGDACLINMIPTKPMVVEPISIYPPLGRFAVLDWHGTVAVGVVVSVTKKITESGLKKN
jgi:elongation factor 1-alpha